MPNKKDLKNSMAHGISSGLDSLIQLTTNIQEPEQKQKAVHCNLINQSIYTHLKTLQYVRG